jgi:hypothetical protein
MPATRAMKELMLILEAVRQAQDTLAEYHEGGERSANATLDELIAILADHNVVLAMQQVYPLIDSPSVQPDSGTEAKLRSALQGS